MAKGSHAELFRRGGGLRVRSCRARRRAGERKLTHALGGAHRELRSEPEGVGHGSAGGAIRSEPEGVRHGSADGAARSSRRAVG